MLFLCRFLILDCKDMVKDRVFFRGGRCRREEVGVIIYCFEEDYGI